ncbi:MAG: ornithine carbamoyltransferase, partial [SAR116 cluster bacterium]|nr:ornithine carbamoyltransferase [SAR116 cluster bacterium]
MPNFLDIKDLDSSKINKIIDDAGDWKKNKTSHFLKDKNVLLIFEKPSLRTRISFEVCVQQLGGNVNILNSNEFKLGERESVFDTAKVLER